MAQATFAHTSQALTVQQAAVEILTLINTSPRTPWANDIEAIVSRAIGGQAAAQSTQGGPIASMRQRWWDLSVSTYQAMNAESVLRDARVPETDPRFQEIARLHRDCSSALDSCLETIFKTPAQTPADVLLLADVLFEQLWTGATLTMGGMPVDDTPRTAEQCLDTGPDNCGDGVEAATVALMRGIRDVAAAWAPSPVALPPLAIQLREAISSQLAFCRSPAKTLPEELAWEAKVGAADAAIVALEAQLPDNPQTAADVLMRAELAYCYADKERDGITLSRGVDDVFERRAVALIEAVLAYFGPRVTMPMT